MQYKCYRKHGRPVIRKRPINRRVLKAFRSVCHKKRGLRRHNRRYKKRSVKSRRYARQCLRHVKRGRRIGVINRRKRITVTFKLGHKLRLYNFRRKSKCGRQLRKICTGVPRGTRCKVQWRRKTCVVKYKRRGRRYVRRVKCPRRYITTLKRGLCKKRPVKIYRKVKIVRKGRCWSLKKWNGKKWRSLKKKCGKKCIRAIKKILSLIHI
eukprot:TRINITY_DN8917_c0_g3_i2.p1 TRINITY_DN8917_c0_g3~~TRINITY_DN8917_c0_g3_i2.p1  ORF type:complete len:209 (+),score=41.36 TRINITY_DN8917_c0_g3_i2:158-784(+)